MITGVAVVVATLAFLSKKVRNKIKSVGCGIAEFAKIATRSIRK